MINFLISLFALCNVFEFFIASGALFHKFSASLWKVDCNFRLFPTTISDFSSLFACSKLLSFVSYTTYHLVLNPLKLYKYFSYVNPSLVCITDSKILGYAQSNYHT